MRELWDKIVSQVSDAGSFVEEVSRNGIRTLRSSIASIPLFASVSAETSDVELDRDETHYFLIPFRKDPCGYAVYTIRALPPGVGPANSLPKARVFHLHDPSGVEILEDRLIKKKAAETLEETSNESDLASRLETMGDEIDRESNKVTYGLLIIGGAVALINPVAGVGIAVNAIFPSLGAKASKLGLGYAGKKIREVSEKLSNRRAEDAARSELNRVKPETLIDPLLVRLEQAVSLPDEDHQPLLGTDDWMSGYKDTMHLRVSIDAVLAVYQAVIDGQSSAEDFDLHAADVQWLRHLRDLSKTLSSG